MTKKQFKTNAKKLKREVSRLIDNRIEKVLSSGCLNLEAYDNDFLLPKAFMSAMGEEIKFQFQPLTKEGQNEAKNIANFL